MKMSRVAILGATGVMSGILKLPFSAQAYKDESKAKENFQKFSYAADRNSDIIQRHTKSINKVMESSELYIEFDKARVDLAKKHAQKDGDGNPTIREDGSYVIPYKNEASFRADLETLKTDMKYADEVKKREEFSKGLEAFLDEEIEIEDIYTVPFSTFPLTLTGEQMKVARRFARESEKEIDDMLSK